MKKEYYIFGYGSLVNSLERYRTIKIKNKHIIPAIINKDFGYIRTSKFPAMGIIKTKNNKKDINGLLLKVNENELKKLDTRERCYYRIRVPTKYISIFGDDNNFDKSLPVYIYKPQKSFGKKSGKTPSNNYLNNTGEGFKEYGNKFHEMYLETTNFVKSKKTKRRKNNSNNKINNVNKKTKKKYTREESNL